ncbi:MAG: hypothetical protein IIT70_06605, partial [Clostridia bacterium]|nr:hypothetical protein [Clostridia bacterium]
PASRLDARKRIPITRSKLKGGLVPPFHLDMNGESKPAAKGNSVAFCRAGFFVAEREDGGVSRLRDSMREKGFPSPAPN